MGVLSLLPVILSCPTPLHLSPPYIPPTSPIAFLPPTTMGSTGSLQGFPINFGAAFDKIIFPPPTMAKPATAAPDCPKFSSATDLKRRNRKCPCLYCNGVGRDGDGDNCDPCRGTGCLNELLSRLKVRPEGRKARRFATRREARMAAAMKEYKRSKKQKN